MNASPEPPSTPGVARAAWAAALVGLAAWISVASIEVLRLARDVSFGRLDSIPGELGRFLIVATAIFGLTALLVRGTVLLTGGLRPNLIVLAIVGLIVTARLTPGATVAIGVMMLAAGVLGIGAARDLAAGLHRDPDRLRGHVLRSLGIGALLVLATGAWSWVRPGIEIVDIAAGSEPTGWLVAVPAARLIDLLPAMSALLFLAAAGLASLDGARGTFVAAAADGAAMHGEWSRRLGQSSTAGVVWTQRAPKLLRIWRGTWWQRWVRQPGDQAVRRAAIAASFPLGWLVAVAVFNIVDARSEGAFATVMLVLLPIVAVGAGYLGLVAISLGAHGRRVLPPASPAARRALYGLVLGFIAITSTVGLIALGLARFGEVS